MEVGLAPISPDDYSLSVVVKNFCDMPFALES